MMMKKMLVVLLVLGSVGAANARQPIPAPSGLNPVAEPQLQPTPATPEIVQTSHQLVPVPAQPGVIVGTVPAYPAIPLHRTVVRKERNIHPCAVQKIVSVQDPCNPCCCVCIAICVPPCACEEVTVSRGGARTKFDYGEYEVTVTARRGTLVVAYED